MPSFFNVDLNLPRKSKFNLSHDHPSSHCIGTIDPVLCEYLPTGTDVRLSIANLVRTSPTIAPVFGKLRQDYHIFFVPLRLFTPSMRMNSLEEPATGTFVDTALPTLHSFAVDSGIPTDHQYKVHETSLFARLGYGVHAMNGRTGSSYPHLCVVPVYGYYSIFYNYYANRQLPKFWGYHNASDTFDPGSVTGPVLHTYETLDLLRKSLLGVTNSSDAPTSGYLEPNLLHRNAQYFRGGLLCRSRQSDLFTTFLSSDSVTAAQQYGSISVSNNRITFDQIRTSSAITGFVERIIAAGGRYLDWLTVTSGVKTNRQSDIPEYIGSVSGSIDFDMITNVSGDNFGDLGGRGQGGVNSRRHRFTNSEPGFLMVMYSIIPDVVYPTSVRPWVYATHLSDLYNTSLDRLTWQDLPYRWVDASGPSTFGSGWSSPVSIGKQPAWLEETSIPSRSSGALAASLRYWTFAQQRVVDTYGDTNPYQYPYINPSNFQYIFAAPQQDNFFVYHSFNFIAYKQKSKDKLPRVL